MTRKEAIERGSMFYTGKVCNRHPELNGERRLKSGNCHLCVVERVQKHRAKNRKAYNRKRRERYSAIASGAHVPKKYRYAKKAASAVGTGGE
jgi:hypothetical protein